LFDRFIEIPSYIFKGVQHSVFSEATYSSQYEKTQWVIGANFLSDDLHEEKLNEPATGLSIQHHWYIYSKHMVANKKLQPRNRFAWRSYKAIWA
jgi:hypothetical protein